MGNFVSKRKSSIILDIVLWSALWGIFEATVGYIIHSVSFKLSWLVWYPVACFFMSNVYRRTGKVYSIFFIGIFSASIKMLNLFLPGRIDRVINPSVSIVFEAISMAVIVYAVNKLFAKRGKNIAVKALTAFTMNTSWRLLYILYCLFIMPTWMREVSIVSTSEKLIPFFITQNLYTSILIFIGYQFKPYIFKPLEYLESGFANIRKNLSVRFVPVLHCGITALLLGVNIALQILLR